MGEENDTTTPSNPVPGEAIAQPQAQPQPSPEPVDPSRFDAVARLSMPNAGAGMLFTALAPSSHTITLDTTLDSGGADSAPQPNELLLVALGSCTGMDVISILRKKRQKVTSYSVNVHAQEAKDYPKVYTHILVEHVVGGEHIDPKAVARSIELSITKYCPVHALLSRATWVEHVYRLI